MATKSKTKSMKKRGFKIKHRKLAVATLIVFCLFIALGIWQLSRARQKQVILDAYVERTKQPPFTAKDLNTPNDWRFYRAQLVGKFDNEHTFLLDNKTFHGKIGYEVYTPFHSKDMNEVILVDRGFIPMEAERNQLPKVPDITGKVVIAGMLNLPPLYMALGNLSDSASITWPLRIEFIKLTELASLLKTPLFPYVLTLSPDDPRALPMEWQVMNMGPEKHTGYAIQWFALALTLLILFVALNRSK